MPPAALPIIAIAVSTAALSYGVYAGERASKAQQRAIDQARTDAQAQKDLQTQQFQQQQQQQAQQLADQKAQEAQTAADAKVAQQAALANEQAAIGTNTNTLSQSLSQQQAQALAMQDPLIQNRLNSMGIADSGAYAAQLAKYQSDLQSQAQAQLANYQIGAQNNLTQNTYGMTADQVRQAEQNALLNIQTGQQNMATNFQTQNINNQNNTAYQQYIANLQAAQAQSQQSAANAYTGLAGGIGGGLLSYYGSQANQTAANNNANAWATQFNNDPYSPSMQYQYGLSGYSPSYNATSYENAANSYFPTSQPSPSLQALSSYQYGY